MTLAQRAIARDDFSSTIIWIAPVPRQPRYLVPGIPQHVIQRGVNRQLTFFAPDDYARYIECLGKGAARYGCLVHAYVLMTNHTHLLVTPLEERSIPQLIQVIGREYVQPLNKSYTRSGPLWEGRYRASPVQDDEYLLTCQRYIELNPVRAGMVTNPAEYRYSSFGCNAQGRYDDVIVPHSTYLELGRTPGRRRKAYLSLFQESLDQKQLDRIRSDTNACRVIGNDSFRNRVESVLGHPLRPGRVGRPARKTPA